MAEHRITVEQAPAGEKKKRKKLPFILAGVGILALVPVIGSTFAASITLGSGNVEFGQGTRAVAACDASIGTQLTSSLQTSTASPMPTNPVQFGFGALKLTGIAAACDGKTITVRLAKADGTLIQLGSSSGTTASFVADSAASSAITGTNCTVTMTNSGADASIAFANTSINASDVAEVLVESN